MSAPTEKGVRFLARHLVSLSWLDTTPGKRDAEWDGQGKIFATSGFVVSIRGNWFLITAGHILRDIRTALDLGQRLEAWHLDDGWSLDRKSDTPVPFDFPNAFTWPIGDETGFDYGLVHLAPFYRRQLEANGILAVDEPSWKAEWPEDFDSYVMLGIPSEQVRPVSSEILSKPCITLPLTKLDTPPAVLAKTSAPRWYGRIKDGAMDGPPQLSTIDGMSGGPIFGFKRTADGELRYWVIATQSSWSPTDRVVSACPIQPLLLAINLACEQADQREEGQPSG